MRNKRWRKNGENNSRILRQKRLVDKCNFCCFLYRLLKCTHPLLSFQSQHLLPPRHPVHNFLVHKHPPVTMHYTLTILICDRAINLIPPLQIHTFTWQQSPPGRILQRLCVSRKKDSPLNRTACTHTELVKLGTGELSSKSMKWGVTLPSKSHAPIAHLWAVSILLNIRISSLIYMCVPATPLLACPPLCFLAQ